MSERKCPKRGSALPADEQSRLAARRDECGTFIPERLGSAAEDEAFRRQEAYRNYLLEHRRVNRWAIASLVLGVCAFFGMCTAGIILAPLAVLAGDQARRQIERHPLLYRGRALAVAGTVLGLVAGFCTLAGFVLVVLLFEEVVWTFFGF